MTLSETMTAGGLKELADAARSAVGAGSFSQRCELVGQAQPGPQGAAKAPQSDEPAVWYRTKVTEHYWDWERDSDGDRRRVEKTRTLAQHESEDPFAVQDESGRVTLDPRDADIDEPVKIFDRFERDRGSFSGGGNLLASLAQSVFDWNDNTIGVEREEWIVRPGARLYVLGEASDRTGELAMGKGEGGRYVISLRSEEQLTTSAKRWATAALVATVVLATAGLGLIVAGIVAG
ncbi:MAG: hypothetical protein QOE65_1789 [Solirubrobacteraceae bacterium]|jgi:hypothetical protein|nr:hypothetical protein [Solirubrobacteraceae bacterium]